MEISVNMLEGRNGMGISAIRNVTGYGQIASGRRINRAADDAAGLSIVNKLRANANGTNVATQNVRAGINVTNIADGGYNSIMERLHSIRELSIRAMNGTNSSSDLEAIQGEINQHLQGINEASRTTVYNEQKLLDGSMATMEIASNPTGKGSSIKLYSATLENLGLDGYDVTNPDFDLEAIDKAIAKVSKDRSSLGASANGLAARERANNIAYENMTASMSRIEDLDMAKAISNLRKDETLQKVSIAMFNKKKEQEKNILGLFG